MMNFFEAVHGRAVNYMEPHLRNRDSASAGALFAQLTTQAMHDLANQAVILAPTEYVVHDVPCDMYPDLPVLDHSNVDHLGGVCPRCRGTGKIPQRVEVLK